MSKTKRVWLLGGKDLEMEEIKKILKDKKEWVIDKDLDWGANLVKYEDELLGFDSDTIVYGVELENNLSAYIDDDCILKRKDKEDIVYIEIDHHNLEHQKVSSLRQVAAIIDHDLSMKQKFIAANDSGYIPAMEELADELGVDKYNWISKIRRLDRQSQGITNFQERQTIDVIKKFKKRKLNIYGRDKVPLVIIGIPHNKCATVTDRIYKDYENLIVDSYKDGELNFYGNAEIIEELNNNNTIKINSDCEVWYGGNLEDGYGFWGISNVNEQQRVDIGMYISEQFEHGEIVQANEYK